MAADDPYGVNGILDLVNRDRVKAGKPELHSDVRAKVAADIGGTHDYLNQAVVDGRVAGAEKSHYANLGADKKRAIVTHYADQIADHHAAHNNVNLPGDNSHLSDLFTGKKKLPVPPAPVVPVPPPVPVTATVVPTTPPSTATHPVPPVATPSPVIPPPKKRSWLRGEFRATPDEKLYKAGTALEAANAERDAARLAFEDQKLAAQRLAEDVRLKQQTVDRARDKVDRWKHGDNPEYLRAAEQESLTTQRELLEAKKKLNTQAQVVAERKQAHNTLSKNAEKAEYGLQQLEHKLAPDVTPQPAAPKEIGEGKYGRTANQRVEDKRTALDKRRYDLESAEGKVAKAEKAVTAIDASNPNSGIRKATTNLESATHAHGQATQRVSDLSGQRQALADQRRNAASTTDRLAASRQLAAHEAEINAALDTQKQTQRALDKAQKAHTNAMKPVQTATAAHDAAHQATANGKYTNNPNPLTTPSENQILKQATRTAAAEKTALGNAARRNMSVVYQGMNGGMVTHTADQIAHIAGQSPARQVAAAASGVAAAESKGPNLLRRIWGGAKNGFIKGGGAVLEGGAVAAGFGAGKTGTAIGAVGKTATGFGRNLLIAGAVGGGLLALTSVLSSPKPRRLPDSGGPGDAEDMPVVFNGNNANVGVGAIAAPQPGQQAQMGSWVSRLPSLDETLAMGNTPVPPTR